MNRHPGKAARLLPLALFLSLLSGPLAAGGPEGHAVTGIFAVRALDDQARQRLHAVLGDISDDAIAGWCNWPDQIRDQPEWDWAARQHYVNLPRGARYERQRDCPDGACITEAIKKYAGELQDDRRPARQRQEAFGWLCHLVGDIHQPLHSGLAADRGGGTVDVIFGDEQVNLHRWWDGTLIQDRAETLDHLLQLLPTPSPDQVPDTWNPAEVDEWTGQAHEYAMAHAYPDTTIITEAFAEQAWANIQQRLPQSALRLAQILNAILGEGSVEL